MRRLLLPFVLLALCATVNAQAQDWDVYESEDFHVRFQVPTDWTTATQDDAEVPSLVSVSPDESIVFIVMMFETEEIGTEELLDAAVEMLDINLEGEASEEDLNGMHAWVASASGDIEGTPVGMFITAATHGDNNYVAYIFTEADMVDQNAEVMNSILNSFEPIAH